MQIRCFARALLLLDCQQLKQYVQHGITICGLTKIAITQDCLKIFLRTLDTECSGKTRLALHGKHKLYCVYCPKTSWSQMLHGHKDVIILEAVVLLIVTVLPQIKSIMEGNVPPAPLSNLNWGGDANNSTAFVDQHSGW